MRKFGFVGTVAALCIGMTSAHAMGERVGESQLLAEKREALRSKCDALSAEDKRYKYLEGKIKAVQFSVIPCLPEPGKNGCKNLPASWRFIFSNHEVAYAVLPGTQSELEKLTFPENRTYGFCGTLQKDQTSRSTLRVTGSTLVVLE